MTRLPASLLARTALALALTVLGGARLEAWGFVAHRMVNAKAIDTLPGELRPLFEGNRLYVTEHAIDPDLWRSENRPGEEYNHFIDLDAFGDDPLSVIPRDEAAHHAKWGEKADSQGRLPWRIAEVYRELVAAFAERDPARTLEQAALLGHYVGDAHVPLHAVVNYNGQLTDQVGVHHRWEANMVERFQQQLDAAITPAPARPAKVDLVELSFAVLADSLRLAPAVLADDKASANPNDFAATPEDDRYDDQYYSRYYAKQGGAVRDRIAASAGCLGALWVQAWIDAGRPPVDSGFRIPYVRTAHRAVLVSLDGSSAPVLDDAVARGVMPNLARLRARGATARGSVTSLPTKTAAGHAALFTGAYADVNGITGNEVQVPEAEILESRSGYSSGPLLAEPLWATAARQGLPATVLSATQVFPFEPYFEGKRFGADLKYNLLLLDGYQNFEIAQQSYTAKDLKLTDASDWRSLPTHAGVARDFSIAVAGVRVEGLLFDDPADPSSGFDSVYLATEKDAKGGITLKPVPTSDGIEFKPLTLKVPQGDVGVEWRLFGLSPDGSDILLYRAPSGIVRASKPIVDKAVLRATSGFAGNGGDDEYVRDAFGPTLWEGGDGTAERRFLETVRLVVRQFERLADFGFDQTKWSLLVCYLPYPDELLHKWLGRLDPTLPSYDPGLAARLRPFMDDGLRMVDDYIGHIAERVPGDALLAVGADHGLIGADREVLFNVALRRAGILALKPTGEIDLSKTRAIYFPGNSGYFLVNRASRKQGIVKPEEEESVLRELRAALLDIKDPQTGRRLVMEVIDPRSEIGKSYGAGGPHGGDLYVKLVPGYYTSAKTRGDLVGKIDPEGVHLLDPRRREMHAAFTISGPGVKNGVDLGVIRQIDVAPTLSALLGIDPPRQATGRVLDAALVTPPSVPTVHKAPAPVAVAPATTKKK